MRKFFVLGILLTLASIAGSQTLSPNIQITAFPPQAAAVTPADGTYWSEASTIYVGVTGNVAVVPYFPVGNTTAVVFLAVPAGSVVPVLVRGVNATSTTATDLVRIF